MSTTQWELRGGTKPAVRIGAAIAEAPSLSQQQRLDYGEWFSALLEDCWDRDIAKKRAAEAVSERDAALSRLVTANSEIVSLRAEVARLEKAHADYMIAVVIDRDKREKRAEALESQLAEAKQQASLFKVNELEALEQRNEWARRGWGCGHDDVHATPQECLDWSRNKIALLEGRGGPVEGLSNSDSNSVSNERAGGEQKCGSCGRVFWPTCPCCNVIHDWRGVVQRWAQEDIDEAGGGGSCSHPNINAKGQCQECGAIEPPVDLTGCDT